MNPVRSRILVGLLSLTLLSAIAFGQSGMRRTGFGHGGDGFASMLGRMGDYLDLTDAQRTQMKSILSKEKSTIHPLMQQLAQGNQQMRQLEEASTFDEGKVRTLATQQSQTMTELMVQKARIKSEMVQVLTPDQKTKLTAFEARQQARFQRHFQQAPPSSETPSNQ
jgi:Spy/CpxP family protein refolding chaperone